MNFHSYFGPWSELKGRWISLCGGLGILANIFIISMAWLVSAETRKSESRKNADGTPITAIFSAAFQHPSGSRQLWHPLPSRDPAALNVPAWRGRDSRPLDLA